MGKGKRDVDRHPKVSIDGIAVGDKVRLKPKGLEALGLSRQQRGGEGTISGIMDDARGVIYVVRIDRTDRTRMARLEDLVVHRKKSKKSAASRTNH